MKKQDWLPARAHQRRALGPQAKLPYDFAERSGPDAAGPAVPVRLVAASRTAPSTAAAKPSPRRTPAAPPGIGSAKTVRPASIGATLVSRVDTPAVARTVPRWKA